ncbi:hypothetical protein MAQ5080_01673 [Marinomonas aquimarina]|uniref:Lipoprotein n=1 Tax=Marinomonas aquimarina TaxID=295068 RepID=A0A1A8TEF2_9GAMM|nr:hypothetical protein [Marinomonas aquimarina]SBS30454.1 hypothetical protein MAQ5080_01673 [Marinomonas aquimarina]
MIKATHILCAGLLLTNAALCRAQTLETESYQVEVTSLCPEGEVVCQRMSFALTVKASGQVQQHEGRSLYRLCADGEMPCQFIGYRFRDDQRLFTVFENGVLEVNCGAGLEIVREQGQWQY